MHSFLLFDKKKKKKRAFSSFQPHPGSDKFNLRLSLCGTLCILKHNLKGKKQVGTGTMSRGYIPLFQNTSRPLRDEVVK